MIMLGFAGAFRKSEVVALNVEDLEFCDEGVRITIRRSKTDQEGKGQTIAILRGAGPFCPVRLLHEGSTPLASPRAHRSGRRPKAASASAIGSPGRLLRHREAKHCRDRGRRIEREDGTRLCLEKLLPDSHHPVIVTIGCINDERLSAQKFCR
jgi:hypothetical protein